MQLSAQRWVGYLTLLVGTFAFVVDEARAGTTGEPSPVRRWSLKDLGYERPYYTVYSRGGPQRERVIRFRFPPGATQGRPIWYLLDLRFTLKLSSPPQSGVAWVTATTRGDAATQTRFKVRVDRRGARTHVSTWDRLERGYRDWVTRSRRITVTSMNYLPDRGVRGGPGTIHIALQRYYGVAVDSMRLSSRSAIVAARRGPPQLVAHALKPTGVVHVGETFRLPIELVNKGVGKLDASVTLKPTDASFGNVQPAKLKVRRVGERAVKASFKVRALREGDRTLILAAETPPGDVTGARITLRLHGDEGQSGILRNAILAVVFIPAIVVLVVDHLWRRSRWNAA
jgi:hypothetical protein